MKKLIIGLAGFGLGWLACSVAFKLMEDSYEDEYDNDYCADDLLEPTDTPADENAEEETAEEETTSTETTTESNEPKDLENAEEPAPKTRKSRSKKEDISAD